MVLKLNRDAEFPGPGDFLVCLSRSQYFAREARFGPEASLGIQSFERVPGADPQVWKIEIDKEKSAIARTLLALEEFPPSPNHAAAYRAMVFFRYDQDRNMELSEEEASGATEDFRNRFKEFPVSFETYIKTSLEAAREESHNNS
jgi:hypothetical protein